MRGDVLRLRFALSAGSFATTVLREIIASAADRGMSMLEIIESVRHHAESGDPRLRLARPPVNALNGELVRKLIEAVDGAAQGGAPS